MARVATTGARSLRGVEVTASDAELIARFLNGDGETVELINGWTVRAAAPFRRRLDSEWEDVVQEVRLEVVRLLQSGQYRGEASLRTYLWQVTAHTCLDALRRFQRRPSAEPVDLDASIVARDPSPLARVLDRERERVLLAALESMSRECRELWNMVLSGLSYREVSLRLGVSEGALRVRAHRCRQRVVAALGCNALSPQTPNG